MKKLLLVGLLLVCGTALAHEPVAWVPETNYRRPSLPWYLNVVPVTQSDVFNGNYPRDGRWHVIVDPAPRNVYYRQESYDVWVPTRSCLKLVDSHDGRGFRYQWRPCY